MIKIFKIFEIFIITSLFFGCVMKPINPISPINNSSPVDCNKAEEYWYGNKGDSPTENLVWQCYDWEIQRR